MNHEHNQYRERVTKPRFFNSLVVACLGLGAIFSPAHAAPLPPSEPLSCQAGDMEASYDLNNDHIYILGDQGEVRGIFLPTGEQVFDMEDRCDLNIFCSGSKPGRMDLPTGFTVESKDGKKTHGKIRVTSDF